MHNLFRGSASCLSIQFVPTRVARSITKKMEKVAGADKMLAMCVAWFAIAMLHNVCASMENPLSSYAWRHPLMRQLMRLAMDKHDNTVFFFKTCYCMWGRRFKKPTGGLCNSSALESIVRKCKHKRHAIRLEGSKTGKMGNPYPPMMCNHWSECLCVAVADRKKRRLR